MNEQSFLNEIPETLQAALADAGMPECVVKIKASTENELILDAGAYGFPPLKWIVEVKNYIGEPQAIRLAEKLSAGTWLIAAEKIEPKAKKIFRERGISYIDAGGALYLKGAGLLLFITPEKRKTVDETVFKALYGKAWTKLFLLLLTKPAASNWPLRDIAAAAELGLGTVSQLIKAERARVKQLGTLPLSKDFGTVSSILEQWATVFMKKGTGQKLLGTFQMPETAGHETRFGCAWSGETAAARLAARHRDAFQHSTGLRPESGIWYTKRPIHEVMREMRLVPRPDGTLKIYTQPWDDSLNTDGLAPLPVIYADLLKGDSRSIKEAQKIEQAYLEIIAQ